MEKNTNHNCSYVPTTAHTSGTDTLLTILPFLLNPTGEELNKACVGSRQPSQQPVGFARHWLGPLTLISIEHAHSSTTTLQNQAGVEMCKEWPAPADRLHCNKHNLKQSSKTHLPKLAKYHKSNDFNEKLSISFFKMTGY